MIMKKVIAALQMTNDAVINFLKKYWLWLSLATIFALAIVARIPLYSKTTGDYNSFDFSLFSLIILINNSSLFIRCIV